MQDSALLVVISFGLLIKDETTRQKPFIIECHIYTTTKVQKTMFLHCIYFCKPYHILYTIIDMFKLVIGISICTYKTFEKNETVFTMRSKSLGEVVQVNICSLCYRIADDGHIQKC